MDESEDRTVSQWRFPPLSWFGGMLLALLLVGISNRPCPSARRNRRSATSGSTALS